MKAFPEIKYVAPQGMGSHVMAVEGGMDLRDYFAAKAMQGMLAHYGMEYGKNANESDKAGATRAYKIADLMMKAREVTND